MSRIPTIASVTVLRRLPLARLAALMAVVLCLPHGPARAVDPDRALTQALLRKWQFQQGLPQPTVLKILQTSDRYLWLGTQSGLYRFDGMRFSEAPGGSRAVLKNHWITDLCEDHDHHLWVATNDAGLVKLHDGAAERFGVADGLPSEHVRALLVDRRGDLWAATDAGLGRSSQRGGQFSALRAADGLATNDVRALCEARDGAIWIGGEGNQLTLWDGSKLSALPLASLAARGSVHALLGDQDGSVWVGTTAGLVRFQAGEEKRYTRAAGLADDAIECLTQSRDGVIWTGTRDGISRLMGAEIESFRTRDGLSQSTVYTLCEDHEGAMWVGTKHGLNQFVDRRTIPLTASEGLPSNDTGPVLQDQAGTVWIGTLGKGLARYDGRRCRPALSVSEGLPGDTIVALADGGSGDLWIGTERGLCLVRDARVAQTFTTDQGLPSNVVTCLCLDGAGILWVGTGGGLARFSAGRFVQPEGDADELRLPVQALVDDGQQGLVIATEEGPLFRCIENQFREVPLEGQPPLDVDALYFDRQGVLWLGTQGNGLVMVEEGAARRFTVKDGLYDDEVFGIVADDEDRLWMACSRGIFFARRAELRDFASGTIPRFTCTPFSPTEAQRTVECQNSVQPVVWKMQDGSLWFSTIHGVIIIDPAHIRRLLPPPRVVVEEVQINGEDVNPARIAQVPPGQANLYFRYTALSYASPTRITFRHRLEGFDSEWVEAGSRREAFYTNLPPGKYTFRVSAANRDAPPNEADLPVAFTIEPRFYQTRWFIPAVIAVVALAGWIAWRLRILQVKARMNAVLAERGRIARELHDTLIQGFSGVTMQMQGLAARLRASPERKTLEEIIQDAGQCLSEARRSVGGLRKSAGSGPPQPTGLAAAVAQAARQLTETRDVRLALQVAPTPANLPADVEYNVLRIAQEAITNAVRHSGAGTIEVTLASSREGLSLTVRDDGAGFTADGSEHSVPGHYGLIGMRERASQIQGKLQVESAPGAGTTVRLDLDAGPAGNGAPSGERGA
jgi:ligand-binding sensor domain-containing protein/signal transduction histidine kinase